MAEKVIRVCDVGGEEATHTVRIQDGQATWTKDLCDAHLRELLKGARKPRRGRRAGTTAGTRKTAAKSTRAKPGTRRRSAAKKPAARAAGTRARRKGPRQAAKADVAAEVRKLRDQGLSYRAIGDRLLERGIKPQRAKAWNPIVLGRMTKPATA